MDIARTASARRLPFRDTKEVPFRYCPSAMERLALAADQAYSIAMEVPRDAQSGHIRRNAQDGLIREEICSSKHEGAATPYDTAKEMPVMRRATSDKSESTIRNKCREMRFVISERRSPLTVNLIREIHKIVTEGDAGQPRGREPCPRLSRGRQEFPARVWRENPACPPGGYLERRLALVCEFANAADKEEEFIHDRIRAMILHFAFAYAHPFLDGNDRTARVLCCWPWRVGASRAGGRGIRAREALLDLIPDPGVTRGYPRNYLLSEQEPAPRGESRVRTARSRPPHVAHKAQEEDGRRFG